MVIRNPIDRGEIREIDGLNKVFIPYMWLIDVYCTGNMVLKRDINSILNSDRISDRVIGQMILELDQTDGATVERGISLLWYDVEASNWSRLMIKPYNLHITLGNASIYLPLNSPYHINNFENINGSDEFLYNKAYMDYFEKRIPFSLKSGLNPVSGVRGGIQVSVPVSSSKPVPSQGRREHPNDGSDTASMAEVKLFLEAGKLK